MMAKKTKKELKRRIKELKTKVSHQSDRIACLELHYFPPLNTKQIMNPIMAQAGWRTYDVNHDVICANSRWSGCLK